MLCFGVVLYVRRLRPVLHFVRRRTSCALCFDDAVCFSLAIAIWFAATSCFAPIAKKYAAVGETFCLLCFSWLLAWLCSPSPLEEEVLAFPCSFLAGRAQSEHRRTGTQATACIPDVPSAYCFCWCSKPSNRKKIALRALSAFGAINSTPRGGGRPHLY